MQARKPFAHWLGLRIVLVDLLTDGLYDLANVLNDLACESTSLGKPSRLLREI